MRFKTQDLTIIAMYIAMYAVLAKLSEIVIPFLKMPYGGSVELSIIVLLIASYQLGAIKALIIVALGLVLEYTILGGKFYAVHPFQVVLDYILGFGIYAFACFVPSYKFKKLDLMLPFGVIVVGILRLAFSTYSGVLFFPGSGNMAQIWWGSFVYNMTYNIPNIIISFLALVVTLPKIDYHMKKN